jgi:hypothetical protein
MGAGEARLADEPESGGRAHATLPFSARAGGDERPVRVAHDFDDSQLRPVTVPTRDNAPTADLTCGVAEAVGGHAYGVRDRTGLPTLNGTCECASPPVRHRGQSR